MGAVARIGLEWRASSGWSGRPRSDGRSQAIVRTGTFRIGVKFFDDGPEVPRVRTTFAQRTQADLCGKRKNIVRLIEIIAN